MRTEVDDTLMAARKLASVVCWLKQTPRLQRALDAPTMNLDDVYRPQRPMIHDGARVVNEWSCASRQHSGTLP
eukprot:2098991-Prymnesium_polylepis.2